MFKLPFLAPPPPPTRSPDAYLNILRTSICARGQQQVNHFCVPSLSCTMQRRPALYAITITGVIHHVIHHVTNHVLHHVTHGSVTIAAHSAQHKCLNNTPDSVTSCHDDMCMRMYKTVWSTACPHSAVLHILGKHIETVILEALQY